ncbi:MAG: hypothetical protein ABIO94_01955 [Opitutaceae bacterium]
MKYLFVGALLPVLSYSAIVEARNDRQGSIAPLSSLAVDVIPVRPPWTVIPSPVTEPTKPSSPPARLPDIVLQEVLGTDNLYHDDVFGVSAVYPDRWTVPNARRWGTNNSENTVTLQPDIPTTAHPSMYYQMFPNGYPELEGPEAYFRRVAQNKENQRVAAGETGYKNLPDSFEYRQINGNPSMSYFATFKHGAEIHTEYFTWVLGKKGYVMFFVKGRTTDILAIVPQLTQMAASVRLP